MSVLAKDLIIPDGAVLNSDPEVQIAWIQPPRVQEVEEVAASEEGEDGKEGADGTEESTESQEAS